MKNRNIKNKISTIFLTATMMVAMLPTLATPVFAATNELPDKTQFASVEDLKSFDTNDQNGKNPAKVYFGNNNHQWWIAGSQNGNLTLIATSPIGEVQGFEPNVYIEKKYSKEWNCAYIDKEPATVFENHYGSSPLRSKLKDIQKSYFTRSEQELMKPTIVYTNDFKNRSIYSTNDILYLGYGYERNSYFTIGTNSPDRLDGGLVVDNYYWGDINYNNRGYWLRNPYIEGSDGCVVAKPRGSVVEGRSGDGNLLMPAFELDLSSVLFASTAPAVSTEGLITNNDAFVLRYKSDVLGTALVSMERNKVILKNVPKDTYLVVQNSNGTQSKLIKTETEVTAGEMNLNSFENCKVWLETTDTSNRITYAILANEVPTDAVAVVGDVYYTSIEEAINASSEQCPASLLKDVTVEKEVHIRPKDGAVLNTNGYTLSFNHIHSNIIINPNHKFTINGCCKENKPDLIIGQITTNPISEGEETELNKGLYLNNVHIKKSYSWYYALISNAARALITDCKLDAYPMYGEITNRNIAIFVSGYTELNGHNTIIGDIELSENETIQKNGQLNIIDGVIKGYIIQPEGLWGIKGETLSTVALPNNWEWINPMEIIRPENEYIPTMRAKVKYTIQDDYDYSHIEGYNKEGNYVIMDIVMTIFNRNEWIVNPSILDWTYGEKPNNPIGQALYGNVEFTYKSENEDQYTATVPTEPGNYLMKAYVARQIIDYRDYYKEMEVIIPFTIHKITPDITLPNNIIAFEGDKLSNISLPDGFTWKDTNQIVDCSGEYDAIYTPKDTEHYKTLEVKISIFMYEKPIINAVPSINGKDIILTVGDKLEPLKYVTTSDIDGHEVILEVIENNVDNTKVGDYKITYKATDSKGATITKTIKVTVVEATKDKEVLENVINDKTSNIDKNAYTEESYNAYLDALENAKDILNNKNSTSNDIQKAIDNLNTAINNLKQNINVPDINKSQLEEVVNKYQGISANHYTKESYNAYLNALEKAQAILKDPNANKEDITKALADLEAAYSALQTMPNTADQANVNLYATILIISGLSLAILALKKNKASLTK